MKNILLIQPPTDFKKQLGKFGRVPMTTPPLGLAYVASMLEENGYAVSILDGNVSNSGLAEIEKSIRKESPDLVGISCVTPTVSAALKIAGLTKRLDEDCYVVMGGVHPSVMTNETVRDKNVDLVVRGEGEYTICELVECIEKGDSLNNVQGISYKEDNQRIVHTPDRPFIEDLDKLPFPAWHLLPLDKYVPPPHWKMRLPAFPFLSSRGCPHRCTFCSIVTQGKRHRTRSPKNVVDEIEFDVLHYGARQITFWDPTFPLDTERAEKICKEILRRKLQKDVVFLTETRVDTVSKDLLNLMKNAGFRRIFYGIESGVQFVLDRIKKGFTIEQAEKAIEITKEIGLETVACFMIGLPGDSPETVRSTIEFAKKLDPDFCKFNLTVPYPGSELFGHALKEGTLESTDWDEYSSLSSYTNCEPVYVPRNMTRQQLMELQKQAMRSFYLRPKKIIQYALKIRSLHDVLTYFSIALSIAT